MVLSGILLTCLCSVQSSRRLISMDEQLLIDQWIDELSDDDVTYLYKLLQNGYIDNIVDAFRYEVSFPKAATTNVAPVEPGDCEWFTDAHYKSALVNCGFGMRNDSLFAQSRHKMRICNIMLQQVV